MLELRTLFFEDLSVGLTETLSKTVASSDVIGFAQLTGDRNPIHLSEHFAAKTTFGRRIAHGLYTASLISAVLGTRLPGPGAVYVSQTLNFRAPVKIGDTVEVTVVVAELFPERLRARASWAFGSIVNVGRRYRSAAPTASVVPFETATPASSTTIRIALASRTFHSVRCAGSALGVSISRG